MLGTEDFQPDPKLEELTAENEKLHAEVERQATKLVALGELQLADEQSVRNLERVLASWQQLCLDLYLEHMGDRLQGDWGV